MKNERQNTEQILLSDYCLMTKILVQKFSYKKQHYGLNKKINKSNVNKKSDLTYMIYNQ